MGTHQTPEMEAESSTPIHLLEPGFSHKPVNITVGRVAIRHFLHVSDFPLHSSKSVAAVDFIIWDAQGTRMLATVRSLNGVASIPGMLKEFHSYSICRFIVNDGGFCVHPRYHLALDEFTGVNELSIPYVDRVFNLRCPSDVLGRNFGCGYLVDMCGFVSNEACVDLNSSRGFFDRQMILMIESRFRGEPSNETNMVKVCLQGAAVEFWCDKINKTKKKFDAKPFILVKNLLCVWPHVSGIPLLKSMGELTRLVFKQVHKDVIALHDALEPNS